MTIRPFSWSFKQIASPIPLVPPVTTAIRDMHCSPHRYFRHD
jgi:hypothetical protein